MSGKRFIIHLILLIVAVVVVVNYVGLRLDMAETDREIDDINTRIREQKLANEEYQSILSDENIDDLYRNIAEDDLGYGYYDEKIYKNIDN